MVSVCVLQCVCGSWQTILWSWFSFSTFTWFLGTKLMSSGFHNKCPYCWDIFLISPVGYSKFVCWELYWPLSYIEHSLNLLSTTFKSLQMRWLLIAFDCEQLKGTWIEDFLDRRKPLISWEWMLYGSSKVPFEICSPFYLLFIYLFYLTKLAYFISSIHTHSCIPPCSFSNSATYVYMCTYILLKTDLFLLSLITCTLVFVWMYAHICTCL